MTLLCVVAFSPAAQAAPEHQDAGPGSIGIQLLEGPSNRENDPRAHRYIVDHLTPGTTVRRKVAVVNKTRERQIVQVYPAAATLAKKQFVFGADRAANELTSWVKLDKTRLSLAAGDEAVVKATIAVPAAASKGERYAVIWASVAAPAGPSGNIGQVHRVGIRVYLDIGPGGEPRSSFTIDQLVPARSTAGDPSLAVNVTNTGGRALDMSGSANLSDGPAGQRAGPFPATTTATLAPGEAGTIVVQFPRELPNGPWKVVVALKSGLVSHSLTAQITFPEPGIAGRPATAMTWMSSPWTLSGGALAIGVIILAGLALVARRSRRSSLAG